MDLSVARQKRPTVRAPSNAPNVNPLGNPTLLKLIDVNASAPGSDSVSRTEPSIAVDPEHPNVIVVHGGFGDWAGPQCASIFVSTDSGTSWTRVRSINPPTNIPVTTGPNDTTLAYGANSLLTGSFLTQVNPFSGNDIFTGNTTNPSKTAAFQWNMINDVIVAAERIGPSGNNCSGSSIEAFRKAQPTDQVSTHGTDQPWVTVHSHRPRHSHGATSQNRSAFPNPHAERRLCRLQRL